MKSFALILAVIGSSVLLAEAFTLDVHDPINKKSTWFIEKGDSDSPQGSSSGHKHSDKNPHHDDSHSHEDSAEHRRHARETGDGVDVESRRLGGGSHSRPISSGLGSGSLHSGSGYHHSGSGYHGSSGLGSGSLHSGSSGLGSGYHGSSGFGSGYHGSSGLGSGSHHGSSGLGSGYHGSSGLGSGSLHSGSSGHNRRPSSVRGGTISDDSVSNKRNAEATSPPGSTVSVEGDTVRLTNPEHSCLYSNVQDENVENRVLECNGSPCLLLEQTERHTAWKCGLLRCDILKFDVNKPLPSGLVFQCTEERSLITAPKRCPSGTRTDWSGKCRAQF